MSKRKRSRVPGTPASTDFRIPNCSVHRTKCVRGVDREWVCLVCADEWLQGRIAQKLADSTPGGVVLPTGAKDERPIEASFREVLPNRAFRRAAQRSG